MPLYEYQCDCGLSFERILKQPLSEVPCISCGRMASKAMSMPSYVEHVGVGSFEASYPQGDRLIGRDADIKHEEYEQRRLAKTDLRLNEKIYPLMRFFGDRPRYCKGTPTKDEVLLEYSPLSKDLIQKRDDIFKEGLQSGAFTEMGKNKD